MYDVIVIGAGPAGLNAAIYARRAGLSVIVLEKMGAGGAITKSWEVENYLGFPSIKGMELAEKFAEHGAKYAEIRSFEEIEKIERRKDGAFIVKSSGGEYEGRAIVIATGSSYKKLDVPGESKFNGKGVSYCATCDGYFFRGKKVAVVGGGNTALTDAAYLHDVGCDAVMIHRRNEFRAEKAVQQKIFDRKIKALWDNVVLEIKGETKVSGLRLKNVKTGAESDLAVDGVFVAVGEIPQNEIAKVLGVELTEAGYVKTDKRQRTNIPLVYAAGDITGEMKQLIVAAAQGAIAATSAWEDLKK
ncbi:MAG: thioredoxin-disulfide reductase [Candidatus Thermoplasmatota archaeon]|nr:thioredoxin-disulfide reductase [Candidatus Thermoplasmatota archaeon]